MMIMKKTTLITLITCLLLVAAGVCYFVSYLQQEGSSQMMTTLTDLPGNGEHENDSTLKNSDITEQHNYGQASGTDGVSNELLHVHLCGAVRKPAVYKVAAGARLVDVINLAEGLTEDAAGDYINQASLIEDGQRIYIPTLAEVEGLIPGEYVMGEGTGEQEKTSALININQADAKELMELPGIGQAKADSIITYRNTNGTFTAIEELMNIPGIKEGLFGQIASYITVR